MMIARERHCLYYMTTSIGVIEKDGLRGDNIGHWVEGFPQINPNLNEVIIKTLDMGHRQNIKAETRI